MKLYNYFRLALELFVTAFLLISFYTNHDVSIILFVILTYYLLGGLNDLLDNKIRKRSFFINTYFILVLSYLSIILARNIFDNSLYVIEGFNLRSLYIIDRLYVIIPILIVIRLYDIFINRYIRKNEVIYIDINKKPKLILLFLLNAFCLYIGGIYNIWFIIPILIFYYIFLMSEEYFIVRLLGVLFLSAISANIMNMLLFIAIYKDDIIKQRI